MHSDYTLKFKRIRVGESFERRAICNDGLQNRSAILSSWINGSRHGVQAVRIGGAQHGTEIVVADRERISHSIVKRNVRARVVAHGEYGIIGIDR